ncbi:MAG: flagellar hook protein FlgE [Candidatus Polarisedimenticolaceae bacterium]|nr:flagellar hook protein FlgE [Candidatus Polarisedimenticolaceae bacterium]
MPFRVALSGLDAASTDLEVTGHNIANSSTTGFKQSRAEFADIYANSIQDVSATTAGRGVRVVRVAQQFSQGGIDFTANNLDLAINGEGFFIMADSSGNTSYTRAGAFGSDRDGYVVNHAGDRLQVFAPIGTTGSFNTGTTTALQLPSLSGPPSPTTSVVAALNLDSAETVPTIAFSATNANSYNHSTSTTIYDSQGGAHTQTMYFRKIAPNSWEAYTAVDGSFVPFTAAVVGPPAVPAVNAVVMNFDNAGVIIPSSGDINATGGVTLQPHAIAGVDPITLSFDYSSSTQFGGSFDVNELSQDGFSSGRLSGIDIDGTGVVFARFTNGQSTALGKVAMARFSNPQGMRQLGDTSWAETFTSGDPAIGEAGTSSFGLMQSGALESSNVDIAEQLVNLITAQRNFQANAQVITTADTVTQTIINLR